MIVSGSSVSFFLSTFVIISRERDNCPYNFKAIIFLLQVRRLFKLPVAIIQKEKMSLDIIIYFTHLRCEADIPGKMTQNEHSYCKQDDILMSRRYAEQRKFD